MWFCDALRCAQVGDGTSGTNRLTPVAVSGLSSGVAIVSAGNVQSRVVCSRLCVLVDDFRCVCLRCVFVRFWVRWG